MMLNQFSDWKLWTDLRASAELEEQIRISADASVNVYNKAAHTIIHYIKNLEKIIDEAVNAVKPDV